MQDHVGLLYEDCLRNPEKYTEEARKIVSDVVHYNKQPEDNDIRELNLAVLNYFGNSPTKRQPPAKTPSAPTSKKLAKRDKSILDILEYGGPVGEDGEPDPDGEDGIVWSF